jgi:hypothetical protein
MLLSMLPSLRELGWLLRDFGEIGDSEILAFDCSSLVSHSQGSTPKQNAETCVDRVSFPGIDRG